MTPIDYTSLGHISLNMLLILGVILLFFGGEWLCRGGSALAVRLDINPIVIGLTIVSIATSMPELVTSFYGAVQGSYGLAVGNIVGSNIANIGLILGLAAIVCPVTIHSKLIRAEVPLLMSITLLFTFMCWNGTLSQLEGIILLLITVAYFIFTVKTVRKERKDVEKKILEDVDVKQHSLFYCIFFILIGSFALQLGAEFLIKSSVELATRFRISEVLIGVTIVAVGTSLPELAASMVAALRGHSDICAGNVIGSNLFNIILIGGSVSIFYPLEVDRSMLKIEYSIMILLTAIASGLFSFHKKVTRREGSLLVALYTAFMATSVLLQLH